MVEKHGRWPKGDEFERRVAALFRGAGYYVRRDVNLLGKRADAIAEKHEVYGLRKIAIESKNYEHALMGADVMSIMADYQPAIEGALVDGIVIVARRISPSARSMTEGKRGFYCLTIDELEDTLKKPASDGDGLIDAPVARNARSKVAKAVIGNWIQIGLSAEALLLLIDEKLDQLRAERPNSSEAKVSRDAEITHYEALKQQLQAFRGTVLNFSKGKANETAVVKSTKSFVNGVRDWWTRGHEKICEKAFDMGMFLSAVGICSLAGSGGQTAVLVSAALVGGKPVIDALKSMKKIL
jgi:hypothetical protein